MRCAGAPFIALLFLVFLIGTVATAQTVVLTNTGVEVQGSLSGLAPVIRLNIPAGVTFVGPAQAFDIPTSTIRQITVDFPRVVVETADRVYVGPYSAFQGIDKQLVVHEQYADYPIAFTSVRAISLQGGAIQPVPRTWLGNQFLVMPLESVAATQPGAGAVTASPSAQPSNWSSLYQSAPAPAAQSTTSSSTTPWWMGLVLLGAVAVAVYLFLIR